MKNLQLKVVCSVGIFAAMFSLSATAKSEVTVYGLLHVSLDHAWTTGATSGVPSSSATQVDPASYRGINRSTSRETSNSSRIGFRGTEDLDGGLQAFWQLEGSVDVTTGNGALFTRNSGIGLSGSFGRMVIGNWDTPYKKLTTNFGGFGTPTAADGNIIGNPGFGVPASTTIAAPVGGPKDASFDRRQGNSVVYWSPEWAGLSTNLAYSFGNDGVNVISGSATVENGPWTLQYGYERHNNYFGLAQLGGAATGPTNSSSRDTGHKLIAKYVNGNTTVMGVYERLKYKNNDSTPARITMYERDAWLLVLFQKIGKGQLWVAYGKAKDGNCERAGGFDCSTNGLGATQKGIGYLYNLSKRTAVYAFYNKLSNGASGRYSIAVPVVDNEPGATAQIISAGIVHRF